MTCYSQSQPGVRGYRQRLREFHQAGEQRCDQVRMIQKKGWLSQLQLVTIKRRVESGEDNAKAKLEEQNRTGTELI